jgi:cell division protein FtsZ
MGKAMMGTGEATGDKRAVMAAEAAIANPLLDEVSMKGARGLLISITGGNDLTLYEVDEAASRIRQEVDDDANIILGATFDQSLDGIVRVSVVATGIDTPVGLRDFGAAESRIVEAAQKLRAQSNARFAEPAPRAPMQPPVAQAPVAPPAPPVQEFVAQPEPQTMHDVEIRQAPVRPVHYAELPAEPAREEASVAPSGPFIPPVAEQPVMRPPRMPQIDELPLPAQNQLRAQRNEGGAPDHPVEAKRRSLLDRLAAFGMSRQDESAPPPRAPMQPAPPRPQPPTSTHLDYGKRPVPRAAQGQLDQHGRGNPPGRPNDEDQLEIPAFLRRQSS